MRALLDEFARLNPVLLAWWPSILDAYYPVEVLRSDLLRRVFLMPRLGRLDVPQPPLPLGEGKG